MEIIAHRGAMRLAPENTLAAQRLAYELGADIVECDVRLSKDNIPVIMHDHDLDRTTNTTGLLWSRTVQELKQLDAGSWFGPEWAGERIPTLAEMLEVAKAYNRQLLLHIKGQYMELQIAPVIRASGIPIRQISFLTEWQEPITNAYSRELPGAKVMRAPRNPVTWVPIAPANMTATDLEAMRTEGVSVLVFSERDITRANIRRFQAAGFEVSQLYSNLLDAFIYEDAGLNSFWTDYPEVTVPRMRRTSQEWANWADVAGLAPDQRRTWQDADGDGVSNLIEYALGTDPLQPDRGPAPVPGFQIPGTPAGSPAATSLDWTVDLRENWSEFLNVTPQSKAGSGVWTNMPASCCATLTPSQLLFQFPVGTSGSKFFRLKFDLK